MPFVLTYSATLESVIARSSASRAIVSRVAALVRSVSQYPGCTINSVIPGRSDRSALNSQWGVTEPVLRTPTNECDVIISDRRRRRLPHWHIAVTAAKRGIAVGDEARSAGRGRSKGNRIALIPRDWATSRITRKNGGYV